MKTPPSYKILLVIAAIILFSVLSPTVSDARADIYAYTKYISDLFGIILGYLALFVGLALIPVSGGKMRLGLIWFSVGMFIMGSSMFFGPVLGHYKIIGTNIMEGLHGLFMLGGMIGYLFANYWFLEIIEPNSFLRKNLWYPIGAFFLFALLFFPTMFVHRTFGFNVEYWTLLASFGISGAMLTMTVRAYRNIGVGYKKAMNVLLLSTVFFSLSYLYGPIGPANHFWVGGAGGTLHHGFMALGIISFLVTSLYLRRLDIYYSPTPSALGSA